MRRMTIILIIVIIFILICVFFSLIGINVFNSQANTITSYNFPLKQKWMYQGNEDVTAMTVSPTGQVIIRTTQSISSLDIANGQLIWSNRIPKTFGGGGPIISDNIVVVAHSQGVNAYDLQTGKQLWQAIDNVSKGHRTFVSTANSDVVVISGGFIGINDLRTGNLLWTIEQEWPGDSAIPIIDDNKLYVIFSNQIRSYNIKSGELDWVVQTPFWSLDSALLEDKVLYLEMQSSSGVGAFDIQKRKVIWEQQNRFRTFSNPITKYKNYLFVPIQDNVPTTLDAQTGDILWQTKELPIDTYLTSLATDDIVYTKDLSGRNLYALDLQDGTKIGYLNLGFFNIFPAVRKTSSGPLLVDSLVIFADNDRVFAYEK